MSGQAYRDLDRPSDSGYDDEVDIAAPVQAVQSVALPRYTAAASTSRGSSAQSPRRDLPQAVLESREWRLRCDGVVEWLRRHRHANRQLAAAINERIFALSPFRSPIPSAWDFDLAFAKAHRDVGYLKNLHELVTGDQIADDGEPHRDYLCFDTKLIGDSRSDLAWYAAPQSVNRQLTVTLADRRFERRARHVYRVIVPYHCREIDSLTPVAVTTRYCALPAWWAAREGTYSDLTETPPVLSYLGSWAMDPYARVWAVARTELASLRMHEVLASARAGRLLWISAEIIDDILYIGLEEIFYFNTQAVVDDAQLCIDWIRKVDWRQSSAEHRHLPGSCNEITPTFAVGGDWIPWDPVAWRPLAEIATVTTAVVRETVVAGSCGRMAEQHLPHGRDGARYTSTTRGRGVRPKEEVSLRDLARAEHAVRSFLANDEELDTLVRHCNNGNRPTTLAEFMAAVRTGLKQRAADEAGTSAEANPSTETES